MYPSVINKPAATPPDTGNKFITEATSMGRGDNEEVEVTKEINLNKIFVILSIGERASD